jgi:serpin B
MEPCFQKCISKVIKGALIMFGKVILLSLLMATAPKTVSTDAVVNGNTEFAIDIYQELSTTPGNLFFSPYSISSALSMTCAGARGNTENEILNTLHQDNQLDLHTAFKSLNDKLFSVQGYELNIANGLCLTGLDVKNMYKDLLERKYNAEIFPGNLKKINEWVSNKTQKRIPKILNRLDRDSACVLLNAVYFKADWQSEFKANNSRYRDFFIDKSNIVSVPMMNQTNSYKYLENSQVQIVEMPYNDGASMVVILPAQIDGLPKFESDLSSLTDLLDELDSHQLEKVKLVLPKLKMETDYDLVPVCMELGMKDAFSSAADFSGMSIKPLSIAQIKHKAFLEVDEKGTEAAAATAVEMKMTSMPIQDMKEFIADHPFMFLIKDNDTGVILFLGRVANPDI